MLDVSMHACYLAWRRWQLLSKGLSTLNVDSINWIARCEFNAQRLCPHCFVWNKLICAHWLQVATPPHSYHSTFFRTLLQPAIVLLLGMSRCVKQCLVQRSMLTVDIVDMCMHVVPILVCMCNAQLCSPDHSGSKRDYGYVVWIISGNTMSRCTIWACAN